ncbi:MAG: lysophospholipid acyltransferase family protein [Acidimicrobiales bacterium]
MRASTLVRRLSFPYRAPPVPRGVEPPVKKKRVGLDFETEWARRAPARLARGLLLEGVLRPSLAALADPERRGGDRLAGLAAVAGDDPPRPVIFAANHHSHIDTPLVLTSLPPAWRRKVFVAAASDYFFRNQVTGTVSALVLNAIPIERTRVNRRSADDAAALIDDGWSLLIFPEGGRSPDGWGQPFRGGAAYLALRCRVPVVPIYVDGTGRILRKGKNVPTPSRTVITFGAPMWPDDGEDSRRFAVRIEAAVAALADETTTDWYSARLRAARGETPPLTGPEAPTWRRAWALDGGRDRESRRRRRPRWPDLG